SKPPVPTQSRVAADVDLRQRQASPHQRGSAEGATGALGSIEPVSFNHDGMDVASFFLRRSEYNTSQPMRPVATPLRATTMPFIASAEVGALVSRPHHVGPVRFGDAARPSHGGSLRIDVVPP